MSSECISLPYNDSLRNIFFLSETQQIIIYILSPFIYLTAAFNIRFFLKGKRKAEPPADILLFVCLFGILRITSYITSAVYTGIYHPSNEAPVPSSFQSYCTGTGFINTMCEISSFVYNIVFGIYYVIKIKNPLKSWIKQHRELHIFCLFIIVIATLILYLADLIGISILGVCGFKIGTGIIFLEFGLAVSYFIVMVVSSFFFLTYLRSVSNLDGQTKIYFRFYFKYLLITAITSLIGIISLIVVTIKCFVDSSDAIFQTFSIICNVIYVISPIYVFLIMLGHPEARFSSVLKYLNNIFNKQQDQHSNENQHEIMDFYADLQPTKRTSLIIQLKTLNLKNLNNNDGFLTRIKDKNKACLISTILGCLSLQENQFLENITARKSAFIQQKSSIKINQLTLENFDDQDLFSWHFSQKYQFQLTQDIVKNFQQFFSFQLPSIHIKFTSYCPAVFKKIQRKNKIYNLQEKLLPKSNQKNILKKIQADGGRSGQFFFFNYDNTLIIKTITLKQLQVLLNRMQPYYEYFQKNSESIIVRIYGLYKTVNYQANEQFSFMLMGNILKEIDKKYVIRSYDMKGSRYQRQVLTDKQLNQQNEVETKKTLKDIDFHTLQGKIYINSQQSNELRKIIEEDTLFLCSQGLIDYSLIIIKIDYGLYVKQHNGKQKTQVKIYQSIKQEGIAYVLGIIDYLQTWNIKKKGEKWYKSIFNNKNNISSQNPRFYAQRFMKNLINVILP